MFAAAPPTQSIWATFLPSRSAALAIVSAWSTPARGERGPVVERVTTAEEGVVRRAVLGRIGAGRHRVPADAGVRRERLEHAVVAGDAGVHQCLVRRHERLRRRTCSTRSGRMPSDANITVSIGAADGVLLGRRRRRGGCRDCREEQRQQGEDDDRPESVRRTGHRTPPRRTGHTVVGARGAVSGLRVWPPPDRRRQYRTPTIALR